MSNIRKALTGKYIILFILWMIIFSLINYFSNEIYVVGAKLFRYPNWIKIPYIIFTILNTIGVALVINLIIIKVKDLNMHNAWGGVMWMIGTFGALLTGACPGCIAGIFPALAWIFGSTFSLSSLPRWGIEIQLLSTLLLVLSIYLLNKPTVCRISTKANKKS